MPVSLNCFLSSSQANLLTENLLCVKHGTILLRIANAKMIIPDSTYYILCIIRKES